MKKISWKHIVALVIIVQIFAIAAIKLLERRDWYFDDKTYTWNPPLSKDPTPCPTPLLQSFADMSQATGVLYPGQYRGTDYKPHGGIGFTQNNINITLPLDAKLIGGSRYIQNGDMQYLLDFQNDCGIIYRFDHLLTLTPTFEKIAAAFPAPQVDDTRGVRVKTQVFPAGTTVATAVGVPSMNNAGMDFGLYDLRYQNRIAQNDYWRSLHTDELMHAAYGTCWFALLPPTDVAKIKELEKQYGTDYPVERAVSDYCEAPGGTTLDQNNGLLPHTDN